MAEIQMVVFMLESNGEKCTYGVPITQVQEIIRLMEITKIPQTADFIKGIISLRGKVIPVMDLKKRFAMEECHLTDHSRIIVFDIMNNDIGIIVDEVTEVLRISTDHIEPAPETIGGITAEYLTGIGKVDSRLVIILDLQKILTISEQKALVEMA